MKLKIDDTGAIEASASGERAVLAQTQILTAHLRGRIVMRLGLYTLGALCLVAAAILAVFAPTGKEWIATIFAAAFLILAAGAAGFGTFYVKIPGMSVGAKE